MDFKNKTFPVFESCELIFPSDKTAITGEETNVFASRVAEDFSITLVSELTYLPPVR